MAHADARGERDGAAVAPVPDRWPRAAPHPRYPP